MLDQRERIRLLNDELRIHHRGGRVVVSRGIASLSNETLMQIDTAVSQFSAFDERNDPYSEHDFAVLPVGPHTIMFKIDYYDLDLASHSPDPSDPALTRRVLTIMLAEEY